MIIMSSKILIKPKRARLDNKNTDWSKLVKLWIEERLFMDVLLKTCSAQAAAWESTPGNSRSSSI